MSQDRGARVFVVDDDQVIAESLGMILRLQGYDAYIFTDAIKALEAASEVRPDLLITDVMTPELTGVGLAIRVHEFCPDCKMILFSGFASAPVLLKIARANGHNFEVWEKPLEPPIFLEKIRRVLAGESEGASLSQKIGS